MPIISLTSDFGYENYSVAVWRGKLLSLQPDAQIVDISHHITPYNIAQAAYILKTSYGAYPDNSIHCVNVYTTFEDDPALLVFKEDGHWFVGPDNGIFSLIFAERDQSVQKLYLDEDDPFPIQSAFARIISHLLSEEPIESIGHQVESIKERISLKAVTYEDEIRGSIVHIDRFGNAVVNIDKHLFESVGRGRTFSLFHKAREPIVTLSKNYRDVPVGDFLCRFNSSGYLEIAQHAGNAADELGFNLNETVQIVFKTEEKAVDR